MASRVFKWKNRSDKITKWFRSHRVDDDTADITLCCAGGQVRCHRFVLAAASPYFDEMFENGNIQDTICFLRMTIEDLLYVLTFIYDGSVALPNDRVQSFEEAARKFRIDIEEDNVASNNGKSA